MKHPHRVFFVGEGVVEARLLAGLDVKLDVEAGPVGLVVHEPAVLELEVGNQLGVLEGLDVAVREPCQFKNKTVQLSELMFFNLVNLFKFQD